MFFVGFNKHTARTKSMYEIKSTIFDWNIFILKYTAIRFFIIFIDRYLFDIEFYIPFEVVAVRVTWTILEHRFYQPETCTHIRTRLNIIHTSTGADMQIWLQFYVGVSYLMHKF